MIISEQLNSAEYTPQEQLTHEHIGSVALDNVGLNTETMEWDPSTPVTD